ncbi:unnamed protein product [Coffea canephora]|uniref:DH200=94 genomic scaffold, scaffold_3837 n=1 Tax=Coffea canephora TaxID=49390 RepID=A0A068VLB7_COFCA|nr:unnamed protein product [Coffea canephora]
MLFHNCQVIVRPRFSYALLILALKKAHERGTDSTRTYLGRPWKVYAQAVFLTTFLESLIHPEGWLPWNTPPDVIYYGEYHKKGLGSPMH